MFVFKSFWYVSVFEGYHCGKVEHVEGWGSANMKQSCFNNNKDNYFGHAMDVTKPSYAIPNKLANA